MPTLKYEINKSWDGDDVSKDSVVLLEITNDSALSVSENSLNPVGLVVKIDAPYFDDPPVPKNIPPGSTPNLWDYEVVEVFFLGNDDYYLEAEFGPKGHYLLLKLHGYRNVVKESLPLGYFSTQINESLGRWTGEAVIPYEYFPQNVNKLNAYAIHKSDPSRIYMSLYPTPKGKYPCPDFHRLEYFQPADFSRLLPQLKKQ